jgi:hypothetical protein
MPRLRRKQENVIRPQSAEWAICLTEYRTGVVGMLVQSGERRRIDDPLVQAYPEFWNALVPIEEVANAKQK